MQKNKLQKTLLNTKSIKGLQSYCKNLRDFNLERVVKAKLKAINYFFAENGLDACVLGLSGGADSTLVLKLLLEASNQPGSPIRVVLGCFMPIYSPGITDQDKAEDFVKELNLTCQYGNKYPAYEYQKLDLSAASMAYRQVIGTRTNWHIGQIDSIVRTPALYGMAAKLQTHDFNSIVVGTTNRDEGAYIGFYGKQSDGAVDLQPIADLHKSEVYAMLEYLDAPESIISRTPQGDVHDSRVDEEMFGAPYWFLEMYQILMENKLTHLLSNIDDCQDIDTWVKNIEEQHKKNEHKYKVGTTAHYIDVMKRTLD